jgi:hypothetical protein
LTPGSGIGRKSASESGIRDDQPESYFLELRNHFFLFFFGVKILKFFDADPGSGMETVRIRDPGWNKVGSGIRDTATKIYRFWKIRKKFYIHSSASPHGFILLINVVELIGVGDTDSDPEK